MTELVGVVKSGGGKLQFERLVFLDAGRIAAKEKKGGEVK